MNTSLPALLTAPGHLIPIADQARRKSPSDAAQDFFGAKIANDNTRAAYIRDTRDFAAWCETRGLHRLEEVQTLDVASYRDQLRNGGSSPATLKRKLSALRKLFSYMVETGALPFNPAREVTTEPAKRSSGKTPALHPDQMRQLFESFNPAKLIDLRDRAFIGVMAYTFARVSAVCGLRASHYIDLGRSCFLTLNEKGGIEREIPVHPRLAEYLDAWIEASGIKETAYLFPAFHHRTRMTSDHIDRGDALDMVKRRLKGAGLPTAFSNHSFRATGITQFLENGGSLETAQQLANHADSRTTKLYDRRATRFELEEIIRIRY